MNELTREQLSERWGISPHQLDAIQRGLLTDIATAGDPRFMLAEVEAVEDCGLHAAAVLRIGGDIDASWLPAIHGDAAGTSVTFGG